MVISYFTVTLPFLIPFYFYPGRTRKLLSAFVSLNSKLLIRVLGVEVRLKDKMTFKDNGLVVSNHVSYIDIIVLSSIYPIVFVTSKELRDTFFLGQLARLAGCVFIDRKSKANRNKELEELSKEFVNGHNIVIFPEATSTNGDMVRQFKKGLFPSIIKVNKPVHPVTINYLEIDNQLITKANRDLVFWYDDMTFFTHFFNFLKLKKIVVEVHQRQVVDNTADFDPIELANLCHKRVEEVFSSPM